MPEHKHPTMRARVVINSVEQLGTPEYRWVNLGAHAVYSSDPEDPNYTFSQATPNASLTMTITNQALVDKFKVGQIFDVDFTLHKDA